MRPFGMGRDMNRATAPEVALIAGALRCCCAAAAAPRGLAGAHATAMDRPTVTTETTIKIEYVTRYPR